MIEIWSPRWHDRKVLIAKYRVCTGDNHIILTKENLAILTEIQKIISEIERLENKKEKLLATLTYYTYSELCKISEQTEIEN